MELENIQECILGGVQTRTPELNLKIPKLVGIGGCNHESVLENRPSRDPSSNRSRSPPDRNKQLFYKAYRKSQIDNGWTTRNMNCRRKVLKLGGRMNIQMNTLEKKIEKMKTIKEIDYERPNPPHNQNRTTAKTRGNSRYSTERNKSLNKLPILGGQDGKSPNNIIERKSSSKNSPLTRRSQTSDPRMKVPQDGENYLSAWDRVVQHKGKTLFERIEIPKNPGLRINSNNASKKKITMSKIPNLENLQMNLPDWQQNFDQIIGKDNQFLNPADEANFKKWKEKFKIKKLLSSAHINSNSESVVDGIQRDTSGNSCRPRSKRADKNSWRLCEKDEHYFQNKLSEKSTDCHMDTVLGDAMEIMQKNPKYQ